jgi:hypothetical protein
MSRNFLSLMVVLAIIAGLVLVWIPRFLNVPHLVTSLQSAISTSTSLMNATTSVAVPADDASVTQGWKLYRNSQYGFEFLYPPGAVVEQQDSGGTVGLRSQDNFVAELLVYERTRNEAQGGFWQVLDVYRKAGSESLKAWFNRNVDFHGELVETTINGYSALDARGGPSDYLGVLNALFVLHNELIIELDRSASFTTDQGTPDQERLFQSLRFTD